jgi:hypothetical protein
VKERRNLRSDLERLARYLLSLRADNPAGYRSAVEVA